MNWPRRFGIAAGILAAVIAIAGTVLVALHPNVADLWLMGDARRLRERGGGPPATAPGKQSALLILAIDGVGRDLLYGMLRRGELPALASLLGGGGSEGFPHAHLDDELLSVLPSDTIPGWTSAWTGRTPADNGVTGNEYFVRERAAFVAPIPQSFQDASPVLATFTDGYVNKLLDAPTVYDQLRRAEPDIRIWVAMNQVYAGADRFLLADRVVLAKGFAASLRHALGMQGARALYEEIDEEVAENVIDELARGAVPDVLTVYFLGADQYAHAAEIGANQAQREYLRDVLDPIFDRLRRRLSDRGALQNRFVLVLSDHGHTDVQNSESHALADEDGGGPPFRALEAAGFRVRAPALDVPQGADFQVVLAYQDGLAFAYVADRSRCERPGEACDWTLPPRYEQDVLPVAEVFHRASATGAYSPELRGTLDLVLTRRPRPYPEIDRPFEVYVGNGHTVPVGAYLARHPRPGYIGFEARLRDLAVGRHGERAGDVLLVPHHGDRDEPARRYYFALPHHSGHGGPGRSDAEVPLVVAHPGLSAARIRARVREVLGPLPRLPRVSELVLQLRGMDVEPHGGL